MIFTFSIYPPPIECIEIVRMLSCNLIIGSEKVFVKNYLEYKDIETEIQCVIILVKGKLMSARINFKKGSMEMLLLHVLHSGGDCYGYQLSQLIKEISGGELNFPVGSLYREFDT